RFLVGGEVLLYLLQHLRTRKTWSRLPGHRGDALQVQTRDGAQTAGYIEVRDGSERNLLTFMQDGQILHALQIRAVDLTQPYRYVVLILARAKFAGLDAVHGRANDLSDLRGVESEARRPLAVDHDAQLRASLVQIVRNVYQTGNRARLGGIHKSLPHLPRDPPDRVEILARDFDVHRCSRRWTHLTLVDRDVDTRNTLKLVPDFCHRDRARLFTVRIIDHV